MKNEIDIQVSHDASHDYALREAPCTRLSIEPGVVAPVSEFLHNMVDPVIIKDASVRLLKGFLSASTITISERIEGNLRKYVFLREPSGGLIVSEGVLIENERVTDIVGLSADLNNAQLHAFITRCAEDMINEAKLYVKGSAE